MCYYNGIKVPREEFIRLMVLEKEIKAIMAELSRPLQSGFEYKNWPILKPIKGGKDFEIVFAHWELIPYWLNNWKEVQESRKKFTTLNAIGEELFEKRTYKDAAAKRRCLILSSGFYEWRHYKPERAKKEIAYPYFIDLPGKEYFYIAGIWQPWTDKETGETIDTFSLVTTKANSLMEQVHNMKKRMPTILPDELAYGWIQDGLDQKKITELATYQYPAEKMAAHTINKDFRALPNPEENYEYSELPPLHQS